MDCSSNELSGSDSDDSRLKDSEKDEASLPSPTMMKQCRVMLQQLPAAGRKRYAYSTIRCSIPLKKLKLCEAQLANLPRSSNVTKAVMGRPRKPSVFVGNKCTEAG